MRAILCTVMLLFCALHVAWSDMPVVKSANGTVEFRRGAAKGWTKIKPGDKLKPEDTMRTGKGARAIVVVGNREIAIPEMVIVELSDFRELSQDEFLLRLAMEDVLRVPPRQQDTLLIPSTTILYGTEVAKSSALGAVPYELGELRLRGVRILFENKFYATSILRTKEVLRTFTDMRPGHAARFQMAQAFEKMNLYHEALREYVALSREQTPPALKPKIEEAIKRLKQ